MRGKKEKKNLSEFYKEKYSKSLSESKATQNDEEIIDKFKLKLGNYTLKSHISRSPWLKSGRPASKAIKWLFQEVLKQPDKYRHNKMLLNQGNLYIFEYKNPKYADTLEYWDKYPLVLALGPVTTNLGIRNIGFNLHLLPIKIRVQVLCLIFEFFKKLYRYQIFHNNENKPVNIKYYYIVDKLEKYSVKFAVRMYIPTRQRQIVKFPYKEWHKAIFIPSRGYSRVRSVELLKKWRDYNRKNKYRTNPNMSWQSIFN